MVEALNGKDERRDEEAAVMLGAVPGDAGSTQAYTRSKMYLS